METYIVRLWLPAVSDEAGTSRDQLRGEVEHPGTGGRRRFTSTKELVDLLQGGTGDSWHTRHR